MEGLATFDLRVKDQFFQESVLESKFKAIRKFPILLKLLVKFFKIVNTKLCQNFKFCLSYPRVPNFSERIKFSNF